LAVSVREKYFCKKGMVPEITEMSNPKSSPPNAVAKEMLRR
jgi:hypothetical protein